jgi:hypothetical protein
VKRIIAAAVVLALSTTFAAAAKRHVKKTVRHATHHVAVVRAHVSSEPSHYVSSEHSHYWSYRLCKAPALARDPYTVCFSASHPPYLGRDPDINVRFELRRDWKHTKLKTASTPMLGSH